MSSSDNTSCAIGPYELDRRRVCDRFRALKGEGVVLDGFGRGGVDMVII